MNNTSNKWKSLFRNMFGAFDSSYAFINDNDGNSTDDSEVNSIYDWYDEIPDMPETPLQDAIYEVDTSTPSDFDPIEYLYSKNANSDIMGSLGIRHAIRTHYNDCISDITEYADYSSPHSERRQETVRIEGERVKISIQISSKDGVSYHIKITFTLEE